MSAITRDHGAEHGRRARDPRAAAGAARATDRHAVVGTSASTRSIGMLHDPGRARRGVGDPPLRPGACRPRPGDGRHQRRPAHHRADGARAGGRAVSAGERNRQPRQGSLAAQGATSTTRRLDAAARIFPRWARAAVLLRAGTCAAPDRPAADAAADLRWTSTRIANTTRTAPAARSRPRSPASSRLAWRCRTPCRRRATVGRLAAATDLQIGNGHRAPDHGFAPLPTRRVPLYLTAAGAQVRRALSAQRSDPEQQREREGSAARATRATAARRGGTPRSCQPPEGLHQRIVPLGGGPGANGDHPPNSGTKIELSSSMNGSQAVHRQHQRNRSRGPPAPVPVAGTASDRAQEVQRYRARVQGRHTRCRRRSGSGRGQAALRQQRRNHHLGARLGGAATKHTRRA